MLLTPPGSGAIATIRIAGSGVAGFLTRHFSKRIVAGKCVHGELRDGAGVIDDPVVIISDDTSLADLNLHAGPWILNRALALLTRDSFAIEGGEGVAPLWAVEGETVLEREVEASLPLARTALALRVLLAQRGAWPALRNSKPSAERLKAILQDRSLDHLLHPPQVAIVGLPNVGKSTLANRLFAQERSITADVPGTTRDWVGEDANIDGLVVHLVDTPGLRATMDGLEESAIRASAPVIEASGLVVLVLDVTMPMEEQRELIERYPKALRVANKTDRPAMWEALDVGALRISAAKSVGIDGVRREIRLRFGCDEMDVSGPRIWTQRQREIVGRAVGEARAILEI